MSANPLKSDAGFTLIAAIIMVAILGIFLGIAGKSWQMILQRDKEEELIFRGRQIRDAIARWQRPVAPPGQPKPPPRPLTDLKFLLEDPNSLQKVRYLRKLYKDPITNKDFVPLMAGAPGSAIRSGATTGGTTTGGATTGGATTGGATTGGGAVPGAAPGTTVTSSVQGIIGVASSSKDTPLKKGNFPDDIIDFSDKSSYSDWQFSILSQAYQNWASGGVQNPNTNTPTQPPKK